MGIPFLVKHSKHPIDQSECPPVLIFINGSLRTLTPIIEVENENGRVLRHLFNNGYRLFVRVYRLKKRCRRSVFKPEQDNRIVASRADDVFQTVQYFEGNYKIDIKYFTGKISIPAKEADILRKKGLVFQVNVSHSARIAELEY